MNTKSRKLFYFHQLEIFSNSSQDQGITHYISHPFMVTEKISTQNVQNILSAIKNYAEIMYPEYTDGNCVAKDTLTAFQMLSLFIESEKFGFKFVNVPLSDCTPLYVLSSQHSQNKQTVISQFSSLQLPQGSLQWSEQEFCDYNSRTKIYNKFEQSYAESGLKINMQTVREHFVPLANQLATSIWENQEYIPLHPVKIYIEPNNTIFQIVPQTIEDQLCWQ